MPAKKGAARKNLIDEPSALSLTGGGNGGTRASAEQDYYELQSRNLKMEKGLENLSNAEGDYVFGAGTYGGKSDAEKKKLSGALYRLHETELIEARCLHYVHSLPDTSPHLLQLKALYRCSTREQIAKKVAEQQMDKLIEAQVAAIVSPDILKTVYKQALKDSADKFKALY